MSEPIDPRRDAAPRRFRWAVLGAVVLGLAGAIAGWHLTGPVYRSEGILHVSPSVPTPRDPEGKQVLPMLDEFVETQAAVFRSRRVAALAFDDEVWQRVAPDMSLDEFRERLSVRHERGSLNVLPRFTHADPEVAAAALKAVTRAFMRLAPELNGEKAERALAYLARRKTALERSHADADRRILEASDAHGGEAGLQLRQRSLLTEVARLEARYRDLHLRIELLRQSLDEKLADPEPASIAAERRRLELEHHLIGKQLITVRQMAREVGRAVSRVAALRQERAHLRERLVTVREAEEQVRAELAGRGRVVVISEGDVPAQPHSDHRIRLAGLLALAGIALVLLPILGRSVLRRGRV